MGSNGYSIEFGDKLIDDCDEGIVKEGNRYKIKVFYDDGVVRDKLCSVRNINKCVVEVDGEKNEISEGDVVEITEHKPISKNKSWVVTKVVSKAQIIN